MELNVRRAIVLWAVAVGSLLLIAPLTYLLVVSAGEHIADLVGLGPVYGWLEVFFFVGAVVVALETASEIAMIRIHGYRALRRGDSRLRVVVRHVALALPVLAATMFVVEFLATTIRWGVQKGDPVIFGLSVVVAFGVLWAASRAVGSYRHGHQQARRPEPTE